MSEKLTPRQAVFAILRDPAFAGVRLSVCDSYALRDRLEAIIKQAVDSNPLLVAFLGRDAEERFCRTGRYKFEPIQEWAAAFVDPFGYNGV